MTRVFKWQAAGSVFHHMNYLLWSIVPIEVERAPYRELVESFLRRMEPNVIWPVRQQIQQELQDRSIGPWSFRGTVRR